MAVEVVVRKLGNSFGVLFSKNFVKEQKLKPNQKILVEVVKKSDLSNIFGSIKTGMSGQEFKDMVRKGWD